MVYTYLIEIDMSWEFMGSSNVLCKLFTQVVFALKAVAEYSTVEIFHDLSQQIGVAIKYEER